MEILYKGRDPSKEKKNQDTFPLLEVSFQKKMFGPSRGERNRSNTEGTKPPPFKKEP